MKKLLLIVAVLLCSVGVANATIDFIASGISAKGVDVTFEAGLTITGDTLTIVLTNNSPVDSLNPDDTLGSFYFDIVNGGGIRPTLAYTVATGDLYEGDKAALDPLIEAGADLMSLTPGRNSWVFKEMDEAAEPYLGFGIGTVGNSNLSPNDFPGMDGVETAIYKGEVTTQNLNGQYLVKDTATFTFTGLTGFTEADIADEFAFGLGTAPDSLLIPEPATMILVGLGGFLLRKRR